MACHKFRKNTHSGPSTLKIMQIIQFQCLNIFQFNFGTKFIFIIFQSMVKRGERAVAEFTGLACLACYNPSGVHNLVHGFGVLAQVTQFTGLTGLPTNQISFFLFLVLQFFKLLFFYFILQYWIGQEIHCMIYFCLFSIGLSQSQINIYFRVGVQF